MYNNSQLFTNVRCSVMSDGVRVCEGGAVLVTPIIVVTTSDGGPGYVNITYDQVMVIIMIFIASLYCLLTTG